MINLTRSPIFYTKFINTMKQEPMHDSCCPSRPRELVPNTSWDYLYEPEAEEVLDVILNRYIEAVVFQAVAENSASEQSARMVYEISF